MDCNGHKFHLAEDSLGREPHYWTGGETRESTSTCCTPRTTTSRITGLDVGFGFYPSSSVTIFQKDKNTVLIAEIGTTGLIRTVVVLMMPHGYWIDPVCLCAPSPNAPPKTVRGRPLIVLDGLGQGFLDLDKFGAAVDFKAKHVLHVKYVNRTFAKGGNTG